MIDIRDIRLRDELPDNFKRDPQTLNFIDALDESLKHASKMIDKINYTTNLEVLDETVIDHLLWENHIGEYEGLILAKNKADKTRLLKSSIDLHRTKGTAYAIEKVLEAVSLRGYVEEWYQYNGLPYRFMVELDVINNLGNIDDVRKMVLEYKNKRSWFDGFVILITAGKILIVDDTYTYPVFYKDCGWFSGEKTLSNLVAGHVYTRENSYDYEVEYTAPEKLSSCLNGPDLNVTGDSYDYEKELKSIGEDGNLDALLKSVETQEGEVECSDEEYDYQVELSACERESSNLEVGGVLGSEASYDYDKEFPIASDMELLEKQTEVCSKLVKCRAENYGIELVHLKCGEFWAEAN